MTLPFKKDNDRKIRLAQALKQNLKKRKQFKRKQNKTK